MTDLMTKSNEVKMTSRDIAELTGRAHSDIMKEIRKEISALGEINGGIFSLVKYTDKKGEKRPQYMFGKKGAMQLALKYDAVTRFKVIEKIEQLESGVKKLTLRESLLAQIELIDRNEKLLIENKKQAEKIIIDKPKVLFADTVASSVDSILIRELAKLISDNGFNTGEKRLFAWMRENGYILKSKNEPTQKSMNLGVMELIERTLLTPKGAKVVSTLKVTGKGQIYFLGKVKN